MEEFSSNELVTSVVHDAAANEGWTTRCVGAVNAFVSQ
jgi:hypothetical protein